MHVEDDAGRAVAGAQVVVVRQVGVSVETVKDVQGLTDDDGNAAFEVAPEFAFVAARNAVGRSVFKEIDAAAQTGRGQVVLRLLADDVPLQGRVVDQDGRGVAKAVVQIWESRSFRSNDGGSRLGDSIDWREVSCGADGRFEVRLCRARRPYLLEARDSGRASLLRRMDLDGASGGDSLIVELPSRAALEGLVVDFAGNPVRDCEVLIAKVSPDRGVLTRTGVDGKFVACFFSGGICSVTPMGNDFVAGGETMSITLSDHGVARVVARTWEACALEGRVVNVSAGPRLRGMVVPQDKDRSHMKEFHVDASTRQFRVGGLVRGWMYDVLLYRGDQYLGLVPWQAGVADLLLDGDRLEQR